MAFEGLRAVAVGTGTLPDLDDQGEKPMVIEGKKMSEFELHSRKPTPESEQIPSRMKWREVSP